MLEGCDEKALGKNPPDTLGQDSSLKEEASMAPSSSTALEVLDLRPQRKLDSKNASDRSSEPMSLKPSDSGVSHKLCQMCCKIKTTGLQYRQKQMHHSPRELMQSAELGCPCCQLICSVANETELGIELRRTKYTRKSHFKIGYRSEIQYWFYYSSFRRRRDVGVLTLDLFRSRGVFWMNPFWFCLTFLIISYQILRRWTARTQSSIEN